MSINYFDCLKMVVYNPDWCCATAAGGCLAMGASEEDTIRTKLQLLPESEDISSQANLLDKVGRIVLIEGIIQGGDVSDLLTEDGTRRCFQKLTIKHTFTTPNIRRVEHPQRDPRTGLIHRTYTNENFPNTNWETVTSHRISALSLRTISLRTGFEVTLPIERPGENTMIIAEESWHYLNHEDKISEAALRCHHPCQKDSHYSVSEEYLESGRVVTIAGTLIVDRDPRNNRPLVDTARIKNAELISVKTKERLIREKKASRNCWGIAASFFAFMAVRFRSNKKYKNETPGMWSRTICCCCPGRRSKNK